MLAALQACPSGGDRGASPRAALRRRVLAAVTRGRCAYLSARVMNALFGSSVYSANGVQ